MTESPTPGICLICKGPLPADREFWHYDCEKCQICGADMHMAQKVIDKCLTDGGPIAHLGCYHKARIQELKDKVIPITSEHIRILNESILMMRHTVNPDETDYQTLWNILKETKELAANISFVMDLTKDKMRIHDRDEYAEKIKTERKQKAEQSAKDSQSEQERIEKQARLAAERENPFLRDKRKAIEGFVKAYGFTLEVATAMVEESMRKAGKDPQTGKAIQ